MLYVQHVVSKLLYYALAIENTILVILSKLGSEQVKNKETTMRTLTHLIDYIATNPDTTICFHKIRMVLHINSGSYLSTQKSCIQAGGYFYLSNNSIYSVTCPHNGPIYVLAKIQKNVLWSAAEAEIGATYANAREYIPIHNMMIDMGHPQPPTPIQVDNTMAVGFANSTIKQKMLKAINMRYCWVQEQTI